MSEGVSPDRAKVIAAAQAAASWARARRALWTDAPLPAVDAPPPSRDDVQRRERSAAAPQPPVVSKSPGASAPATSLAPTPVPTASAPSQARAAVPPPRISDFPVEGPVDPVSASVRTSPVVPRAPEPRPVEPRTPEPRSTGTTLRWSESVAAEPPATSGAQWALRIAAVAVVGAGLAGAIYWKTSAPSSAADAPVRTDKSEIVTPPATGSLRITSDPGDAEVIVDGKSRGKTPLTIQDLAVGSHRVVLRSGEGSTERSVTIAPGKTATMDEAIFAGWVRIYSPFDVLVTEGRRSLTIDDSNQIMLQPGPHDLRITNRALEYEAVRHVEVKPGESTALSIAAPQSALTVTATEPAEIWVDGNRAGTTPLFSLPLAIGVHDVTLRRAGAADRKLSVTVTTKPSNVNVDFSRPGH